MRTAGTRGEAGPLHVPFHHSQRTRHRFFELHRGPLDHSGSDTDVLMNAARLCRDGVIGLRAPWEDPCQLGVQFRPEP